jgi:hypothetical protein
MSAHPKPSGRRAWNICIACAVLLFLFSFSPIVLSPGEPSPALLGIPRTLWLGLLAYIALVAVTYIGTRVHPDETDKSETEGGE